MTACWILNNLKKLTNLEKYFTSLRTPWDFDFSLNSALTAASPYRVPLNLEKRLKLGHKYTCENIYI
jgi:hypothetical protein